MLTFIKERLPYKKDAITVLLVCAFPIFVWSIIYTFFEIPAWLIRSTTWDLIGMIAYTQAIALFESLTLWLFLIIICIVLPPKYFRDRFIASSAIFVFTTTIWFILIHFNDSKIRLWGGKEFLLWFCIYGISIIIMYFLVFRLNKLESFIIWVCEHLSILSTLYLFIGVFSFIIVIIRNLF
ncbi:hypothetical protein ACFLXI_06245 [Chloroflexota bacterium]